MRIELPAAFVDSRGSIQNIIELAAADRPIRGAGIIHSKAGTERSNHWHREDGHYLYVLSGEMHYWEWTATGMLANYAYPPREFDIFKAGECAFTGPNLWHRTRFPVDTVLLSLSFLPRDHESHEKDLVRA